MEWDDDDEFVAVAFIINLLFAAVGALNDGNGNEGRHHEGEDVGENVGFQWRCLLNPETFPEHFRMPLTTFQKLVTVVTEHLEATGRLLRLRTTVEHSLLFTIWMLANPDPFRTAAEQFAKAKSTIHFDYVVIIQCLQELASRYIRWPDDRERDVIKFEFERRYGYPGVIGCIDGTNICITAPLEQKRRYLDRHHKYSVIAQAVCDHNMLFRDIFVGQPGSVGDARTFSRSPLSRNLLTGPPFISEDEHLLGDGAYTLLNQVMKPFVDNGDLDPRLKNHNTILSAARSTIERSFGRLKIKFRRLIKRFQTYSLEYCLETIVACFVLHNFILLDGEDCPGIDPAAPIQALAPNVLEESRVLGAIKRDTIADALYAERVQRRNENAEADDTSEDEVEDDENVEVEDDENEEDLESAEDEESAEEEESDEDE